MTVATANRTEWLDCINASKAMGVSPPLLKKSANRWGIRVRTWEGRNGERYNAADIDAYMARKEAEEAAAVAAAQLEESMGTARTATR